MKKKEDARPRIGETWITRSGISIGIVNTFDDSIRGIDERKVVHRFMIDGYVVGRSFPNGMDLLSKV